MMLKESQSPDMVRSNRRMKSSKLLLTENTNDEDEKTTARRRRVSCDQTKTVKRTNALASPRPMKALEAKSYKIGSDVISFEMEEQRCAQMKIIDQDRQLKSYYLAFKKMFINLFQASHFLMENMFKLSPEIYQNKHVVVLCLLFQLQREQWDMNFLANMMTLAKNILYMANTPNQFERRIDLVARKVTLQNEKQRSIKNAFLNPKIQRGWVQTVEPYFQDQETEAFVEDQFDSPQQKMCFIEIKEFVTRRLCTQSFGSQLKRYGSLEEIDEDMNLDFKFEFLLAQEFSFNSPKVLKKEMPKQVEEKEEEIKIECPLI